MTIFALIVLGLVALYFGAELLVRYASQMAARLGVSPLVIGLTLVAYGTSTPELIVNLTACFSGNTEIAIGNVIGSNIFNTFFILGVAAIFSPLVVHKQIVRLDVPVMIFASLMVWAFCSFGNINFWMGMLFFVCIVCYTIFLILKSKPEEAAFNQKINEDYSASKISVYSFQLILKDSLFIVLGLAILVVGSNLLVEGSVRLAKLFGVSELIIGLTIVAAGTSLPELATSVVAAFRGERDIAVGNVVGSNIYNIWGILGLSALVSPVGLPIPDTVVEFDILVMVAAAFACLPFFLTGHVIYRWEGVLFLFYYLLYLLHTVLSATNHYLLDPFREAVYFFVVPLTCITFIVCCYNYFKQYTSQKCS